MEKESTKVYLNILIVEDVYDDMEVAKKFVKRNFENVNVFGVTTAHDAGEILQDNDIDLLLLDIRLPDGTGFELATKLREMPEYRFLHIIFITGYEYNKRSAKVSWKKPLIKYSANGKSFTASVTGYKVYRAAKKCGKYKLVKTIKKAGTTKWTDKKLKKGKKYFYKVRPYTKISGKIYLGKWSNAAAVKTK